MRRYYKQLIWIGLGLISLLIRSLSGPVAIENIYSRGVFMGVRRVFDSLLTWFPIPLIYLLVPTVIGWAIWRSLRFFRSAGTLSDKLLRGSLGVLATLGALLFFFLWLWGFNYGRQPVEERLALHPTRIAVAELDQLVRNEAFELARLRDAIPGADTATLGPEYFPTNLEQAIRPLVERTLQQYGYPVAGRVRGRVLYPRGILLAISTAGVYFPFTGEGHIDAGLLPIQRVSILAHELAHGYGFGDEGTCSFWAYLATYEDDNPTIAYAGRLGYWRTLAATLRGADSTAYARVREQLPAGIQADLSAIYTEMDKYPDILPWLRDGFYDNYLKAQGIEEGLLNYDRVVVLVEAWRRQQGE